MLGKTNVLLGFCAVLFGGVIAVQPFGSADRAGKIGFVDVQKARDQSKTQLALVERLDQKLSQAQTRFDAADAALGKQKREELPLFVKGSGEWKKLFVKIKLEEQRIKLEKQMVLAELQEERITILETYFSDLSAKVKQFAEANGYDAVFMKRALPKIGGGADAQVDLINLQNQWVLYNSDATDVTVEVAKLLNQP